MKAFAVLSVVNAARLADLIVPHRLRSATEIHLASSVAGGIGQTFDSPWTP